MAILYTNPWLIIVGVLLIVYSDTVARYMGSAFKNTARDAGNPFIYKIIGVVIIITSVIGLFLFR